MTKPSKHEQHEKLCIRLHETYVQKNNAYGDSFGKTYRDLGIISCVTRMSDKFNRIVNLAKNPEIDKGDEAIRDTLMDLANYCLMTVMELDKPGDNGVDLRIVYKEDKRG